MSIDNSKGAGRANEDSLNMCVCTNIRRAARVITRFYDNAIADTGIRYTQMIILMVLNRQKQITVNNLAEELLMDASTVVRNLRPLERQGYINIIKGKDRRQRLVSLTQEGEKTVNKGMKYWQSAQDKISKAFSEKQFSSHMLAITALINATLEI